MKQIKITEPLELLKYWYFVVEGYEATSKHQPGVDSIEDLYKLLQHIITKKDDCYIVFSHFNNELISSFIAINSTTPLQKDKTFTVIQSYQKKQRFSGLPKILDSFVEWGREHNVKTLLAPTTRFSGSVEKCYTKRYKCQKLYQVFERKI